MDRSREITTWPQGAGDKCPDLTDLQECNTLILAREELRRQRENLLLEWERGKRSTPSVACRGAACRVSGSSGERARVRSV